MSDNIQNSVFDVADYILNKMGSMSAMKLQKLVYYSQAWALVWDDEPLFNEEIQAWANGPVVQELYASHRGLFQLESNHFKSKAIGSLDDTQQETIDTVLNAYGEKSAQWLSDQTHSEEPWLKARSGMLDRERGQEVITLDSMMEYYSSI